MLSLYKKISLFFFEGIVEKNIEHFKSMEIHMKNSRMRILLKTWVCMILLSTVISFFASLLALYVFFTSFFEINFVIYIFSIIFFPIMVASITFILFYVYPLEREKSIEKSIDNNLPFATTHMAAIASSGIPPEFMFELLTGFKEYGEISNESKMVMRNIKTFGMSSVDAIKSVGERTPSKNFRELLLGVVSTIEGGGDLIEYLKEMSDKALFDYRIKREKYLKTLSTYADIYTALLVAAPLMMIALLATMLIIGGQVLGLEIPQLIVLVTFVVLPIFNIGYIAFLQMTYPGI
ncbi:MAG: type II secretion system F family protein [Candidatus Aenigmarchaeota archaeon]|nr:type II secretion system F family protein [Candidatus Aenigmarchaeota archaeon]